MILINKIKWSVPWYKTFSFNTVITDISAKINTKYTVCEEFSFLYFEVNLWIVIIIIKKKNRERMNPINIGSVVKTIFGDKPSKKYESRKNNSFPALSIVSRLMI